HPADAPFSARRAVSSHTLGRHQKLGSYRALLLPIDPQLQSGAWSQHRRGLLTRVPIRGLLCTYPRRKFSISDTTCWFPAIHHSTPPASTLEVAPPAACTNAWPGSQSQSGTECCIHAPMEPSATVDRSTEPAPSMRTEAKFSATDNHTLRSFSSAINRGCR